MSASPAKKPKLGNSKNKFYAKQNKRLYLQVGHRGFLATCNFRERDCLREAYNLLNHYADELYGPPEKDEKVPAFGEAPENEENDDIADDLQKEVDATKVKKQNRDWAKQRFQAVDTGATNCLFVRTSLPDPVELGTRIVTDIAQTREQKTRFLLRLVPVEVVCRANIVDITSAAGELFDKYFLKKGVTFAIVFNKRYNNDVKRDDIIRDLAALVESKNIKNTVDLKQAEKTILVEVIKGLCCISVLDGYLKYKKFNLVELGSSKENHSAEDKEVKDNVAVSNEHSKDSQKTEVKETDDKQITEGESNEKDDKQITEGELNEKNDKERYEKVHAGSDDKRNTADVDANNLDEKADAANLE